MDTTPSPTTEAPPRLATDPAGPLLSPSALIEEDPLRLRLSWLFVFRGIVITVLLVTAVAVRAGTDEALFARAAVLLYGVAGAAYASILFGAVAVRWLRVPATAVTYSQLIADAVVATVLVWLTGGSESIFAFLYSLSVLNAAIVLGRRSSLILAAISFFFFAAVSFAVVEDWHAAIPTILTNGASFFLVAVLAGYLTAQLTHTSARLEVAKAQIVKLEELYAAVLASLPSGVMSVDANGRVVYANSAGADILGSTHLIGEDLMTVAAALQPVVRSGDPTRFEVEVAVGGRGTRVLGGSVAPLRGFDDAGSVVVFQDLTELRRLQDDITRAERLAQLGRMAAGLAHEIRNPLAAMTGCLQLLAADEDFRGENKKLLGIVHRETERLGGLVHDFLTYARPAEPTFQRLLFNQTVEQTATAIQHGLKNATLEVGPLPALEVEVDEGQLRQVVWNIIANADRMVEGLAGPQTIRVTGDVEAGQAVLMVDDSGPGVPEEIRAQIFEPFFTTRPDGNGLGLATCQQLIRQNRGTISVGTAPGLGGARFTIRLPKVA